ncbi:MAG: DUF4124 domain-containing protein [Pseudomonadota bacterium]|nr:DUF4124 domain-containing protein [Pseudomonadota bacterium]
MSLLMMCRALPLLTLLLALPPTSQAQSADTVTIYRCVDTAGIVTLQNGKPCAKGQQQQSRRLDVPAAPLPPPMPEAVPTPPAPAPEPAPATWPPVTPPATPVIAARPAAPLPPPPLYRCRTWGGKNSYLNEDGNPPKRCEPLRVQGLDGSANAGGIEACEMREDHCDRIPDEELCTAWNEYNRQAESMVRLGNPDIAAKANALYGRTQRVMNTTTCADTASP